MAINGYTFGDVSAGSTFNNQAATVTSNNGRSVTLSYTFPATSMVDQQPLIVYDPGPLNTRAEDFSLATLGGSGEGQVTYSVPANNGVLAVTPNGRVAVEGAGQVTVTAVKGADATYNQASTSRSITVDLSKFGGNLTPYVNGTVQVGRTLSLSPANTTETSGLTFPTAETLTYQWFAGSVPIAGATGTQLLVGPALVGQPISARVTAARTGYVPFTGTSAATSPVRPGALSSGALRLTGKAKVGKKLEINAGVWTGGRVKAKLSYQWYVGSKKIRGASKTTLKIKKSYARKKLTVRVTGSLPGYSSRTMSAAKRIAK